MVDTKRKPVRLPKLTSLESLGRAAECLGAHREDRAVRDRQLDRFRRRVVLRCRGFLRQRGVREQPGKQHDRGPFPLHLFFRIRRKSLHGAWHRNDKDVICADRRCAPAKNSLNAPISKLIYEPYPQAH